MAIINAITDTWNNAGTVFTAIKMTVTNTASAPGSKLIDLLVGASSKFSVDKDGAVVLTGQVTTNVGTFASAVANGASAKGFAYNTPAYTTTAKLASWANNGTEKAYIQQDGQFVSGLTAVNSPTYSFAGDPTTGWGYRTPGTLAAVCSGGEIFRVSATGAYAVSGDIGASNGGKLALGSAGTLDSFFKRKAAKVIEACDSTGSSVGVALGTGSQTVAQLPAAATAGAGARSFVTDATATTFLTTVTGGGANKVPVVSDGTNWLIG